MADSEMPAPEALEPEAAQSSLFDTVFLDGLRREMVKFARLQLADAHLAEDAVQEALVGALRNVKAFGGRSALKTWVFAILKNKIADVLRRRQRDARVEGPMPPGGEDDLSSVLFDGKGAWKATERPATWGNPEEALREGQFWRVFQVCLEELPGNQARVFMMREFIELDSREICATVGISVSNLNVMLYRARLRLRACLERGWFAGGEAR
jgi:RNA polymerase sigma-70 factor (ECF subfamily)